MIRHIIKKISMPTKTITKKDIIIKLGAKKETAIKKIIHIVRLARIPDIIFL